MSDTQDGIGAAKPNGSGAISPEDARAFMQAISAAADDAHVRDLRAKPVDIEHSGRIIILPETPEKMDIPVAIKALQRRYDADHEVVEVREVIAAYPWDAANAMYLAMREFFGIPAPGPYYNREHDEMFPPEVRKIKTGPAPGDTVEVTWARFTLPTVSGYVEYGTASEEGREVFVLFGEVQANQRHLVQQAVERARELVRNNSLYRGKALFIPTDDDGYVDSAEFPDFIDLSEVNPEELIYSKDVEVQIQTNVFTPIEHRDRCAELGVPFRRGVLAHGIYGVGKSLLARTVAFKAVENDITFITVKQSRSLESAMRFARYFEPCVVFVEDIDRTVSGERSVGMDDILNVIDGVDTKNRDIMVVFTTNNIDRVHKALLRPGRLDAVIHITTPDAEAVGRLVRMYGRGLVPDNEDLTEVCEMMAGSIPSAIREIVERAKLYAVPDTPPGKPVVVSSDSLKAAHMGMHEHLKLLEAPIVVPPSVEEAFGIATRDLLLETVGPRLDDVQNYLDEQVTAVRDRMIYEFENIYNFVDKTSDATQDSVKHNHTHLLQIMRFMGMEIGGGD